MPHRLNDAAARNAVTRAETAEPSPRTRPEHHPCCPRRGNRIGQAKVQHTVREALLRRDISVDILVMVSDFSNQPAERGSTPPSRRRFGRVRQTTLTCNLGAVYDLSAGGMRICGRRRPARDVIVPIRFNGFQLRGPLCATLTWSRRVGLFKHEFGVRFEDPLPEVLRCLTMIAGCGGTTRLGAQSPSRKAA